MKIFPLRPVSQLDKAKTLLKIISGDPILPNKTKIEDSPIDKYVKEVVKETSKLTIDEQGKPKYSVDTKELARRMSVRTFFNNFRNSIKGE